MCGLARTIAKLILDLMMCEVSENDIPDFFARLLTRLYVVVPLASDGVGPGSLGCTSSSFPVSDECWISRFVIRTHVQNAISLMFPDIVIWLITTFFCSCRHSLSQATTFVTELIFRTDR